MCSFDLLHVMVDETTELMDERIAQHIVDLHRDPTVCFKFPHPNATFVSDDLSD